MLVEIMEEEPPTGQLPARKVQLHSELDDLCVVIVIVCIQHPRPRLACHVLQQQGLAAFCPEARLPELEGACCPCPPHSGDVALMCARPDQTVE